jgi:hypothetical protein
MNNSTNPRRRFSVIKIITVAILFLMLATVACLVGGGGPADADCTNVSVNSIKDKDGFVEVSEIITFNCEKDIKYIVFQTTCYSPSGEVLDTKQDSDFIYNKPGVEGKDYYITFMDTTIDQVDLCSSKITSVEFMQ